METNAPTPHLTGKTQDEVTHGLITPPREQVIQRFGRRLLLSNASAIGMFMVLDVIWFFIIMPVQIQNGHSVGVQKSGLFFMNLMAIFSMIGSCLWYLQHPNLPRSATREGKTALGIAIASLLPVCLLCL